MFSWLVINKYTVSIAVGVALAAAGYGAYRHQINKAAEGAKTAQEQLQIAAYNVDLAKSLNTANSLNKDLQAKLEELNNEKLSIESQRNAALDSLRKRPTRAEAVVSASTNASSVAKTCTGSELPREDAEFLTGEAASAAIIAKERDFYYDRYEQTRIKLEALSGDLARFNGQTTNTVTVP